MTTERARELLLDQKLLVLYFPILHPITGDMIADTGLVLTLPILNKAEAVGIELVSVIETTPWELVTKKVPRVCTCCIDGSPPCGDKPCWEVA
jgi:hypothetical protein